MLSVNDKGRSWGQHGGTIGADDNIRLPSVLLGEVEVDYVNPDGALVGMIDERHLVGCDRLAHQLRTVKMVKQLAVDDILVEGVRRFGERCRLQEAITACKSEQEGEDESDLFHVDAC